MALVPVRSKQPINDEYFVTEVGEEHLQRWPDDYEPLTGDDLARYELKKAGVADKDIAEAITATVALVEATEVAANQVATDQAVTDPSDDPATSVTDPTV